MKITLISANRTRSPYPVYPLGLDLVADALGPRHDVTLLDLQALESTTAAGERVAELAPDLVGIALRNIDNTDVTCSESFVDGYRALTSAIRAATAAPIVLGGPGFTLFPDELLRELGADWGVVGEGERLALLVDALERGGDAAAVPGVVSRAAAARLPRPLDELVRRPSRLHADPSGYLRSGGILSLQTKRGCPYRCVYCTYPFIEGHRLRPREPRDVALEARGLQDAGARFLFLTDGTFNADPQHNLEVARALREEGLSIPWGAFFAPTTPPTGYYRELAAAGLTHVELGTESLCDSGLAGYGKPFRVADVLRAHAAARAAGLHVAHYLLLGGPGEDRDTLEQTLATAETLRGCVLFFFCGVRIYPGTPLHELALREGQLRPDQSLLDPVFYRPPGLASVDVERVLRERGRGRLDWIFGAHAEKLNDLVARMHRHGHSGPLWERLVG